MTKYDYDLAIIGSGPGGYVAAIKASQLNMKVLVVEKKDLGGICLNWGCIPTKTLLRSSEIYDYLKNSSNYGLDAKNIVPKIADIIKKSRKVAEKLSKGIDFLFKKNKIDLIYGTASINSVKELEIIIGSNIKTIKAKNIIIASGASPKKCTLLQNVKFGITLMLCLRKLSPKV